MGFGLPNFLGLPNLGLLGGGAPFGFAGRWPTLRRAPPPPPLRPLRSLFEPRPACTSAVFVSARHHSHQRPLTTTLASPEPGGSRLPPLGCFGRLGLPNLGSLGGGTLFGVNGRWLTLRRAPPPPPPLRPLRPLRPSRPLELRPAFAACASAVFVSARACASRSAQSEVIRGHQRSSEAIRSHQRPSEAIRSHQRHSEVIRGNQAAPVRAGALEPKEGRWPQETRAHSRCARAHSRCARSLRRSPAAARRVGRRPRLRRQPSNLRAEP